ncbi:MAG: serine/threonine-protein kinase [Actinomycetota bacterium]
MEEIDLGIEGLSEFAEIGSGGFATVYAATEAAYGRRVAVKVLTAVDDDGRRRFDRERLTMGQASSHPNIVTPLRGGYTDPGNQPYLVMEYLAGGSLDDVMTDGPLAWAESVALIAPIADALAHAHRHGIVHKDIKPANILLGRGRTPKLSDFGIAAITDRTHTSQVAYTLAYAPPETFTNPATDARDHRSDTYSLAATLYTLGTGEPPFTAATTPALINQILSAAPPAVGNTELDAFFAVALHKDPDRRHQSAEQLHAHLQQVAEGDLTATSPGGTGATTVQAAPPAALGSTPPGPATTGAGGIPGVAPGGDGGGIAGLDNRRLALIGGGLAAISAVAIGVGLTLGGGDEPTEAADTTATTETMTEPVESDDTGGAGIEATVVDGPTVITEAEVITNHTGARVDVFTELGDGRVASGGHDGTIRVWDPADPDAGEVVYHGHHGWIADIIALDDGRIVSTATGGRLFTTNLAPSIHLWDPGDPDVTEALYAGHGGFDVAELALLADGRVVSVGSGSLQVWNPDDPTVTEARFAVEDIVDGNLSAESVIGLRDGRVAIAAGDVVAVWNPDDPLDDPVLYDGHADTVRQVTELDDGRIASAAVDVQVWNPDDGVLEATWAVSGAEALAVTGTADGRLLIGDRAGLVHTFDRRSGATEPLPAEHDLGVTEIRQLGDARIASSSFDGTVRLWRLTDPAEQEIYDGHVAPVAHVLPLGDGRIASAGPEDTVRVWDLADPTSTVDYEDPALAFPPVYGVAEFDDGRLQFTSTSDGALHLWDPGDAETSEVFQTADVGSTGELIQLSDGRVISRGEEDALRIWSLDAPGETEVLFTAHRSTPSAILELADGRIASGDTTGNVHLWDPTAPDGPAVVYTPEDEFDLGAGAVALAELADGRIAIGTEAGRVEMWDPADPGARPVAFRKHTGTVVGVLVVADDRVASGSVDGTVQIWDPADPENPVAVFTSHTWVSDLALLDDGRIISAGGNGIRVWTAPLG